MGMMTIKYISKKTIELLRMLGPSVKYIRACINVVLFLVIDCADALGVIVDDVLKAVLQFSVLDRVHPPKCYPCRILMVLLGIPDMELLVWMSPHPFFGLFTRIVWQDTFSYNFTLAYFPVLAHLRDIPTGRRPAHAD